MWVVTPLDNNRISLKGYNRHTTTSAWPFTHELDDCWTEECYRNLIAKERPNSHGH